MLFAVRHLWVAKLKRHLQKDLALLSDKVRYFRYKLDLEFHIFTDVHFKTALLLISVSLLPSIER